ncbi:MAG TPA: D-alanyl-D-alanine carboxypeptidase/D-alanyl-D-alanine-endopeptidase [Gemmatimonadales bacterium]|jgi:serine-type D-Ala-D-Ala carboxypeptidase/endopeptidase (penicillin-binding protein 4)|nr:D-alanyl-D-alanine carboxypeptidase/D-alanyl-D-alanine-endopeptidase [Gemmatimonadales bacterium]
MTDAARRAAGVLALALLLGAAPASAQALQKRIDTRLGAPPINRNLWGVVLLGPDGKPLYGRNADRMFVPASNTKLVVAAVAAALFPPDWTVNTSIYADGPLAGGVLDGDLILYGRGDPTMGARCYAVDTTAPGACDTDPSQRLRVLAGALRARGVTTITGDLVGDGSWFEGDLVNGDWEIYDLNWWYAAPVSGLGFNDNSIDFTYAPGPAVGAPATISFTPDFGTVAFENRTRTVAAGQPTTVDFYREPGTLRVWAEGDVALDSRGGKEYFALPDPDLFAAWALRAALADSGIAVLGATRSTTDSMMYRAARERGALAEVASRPLKDWIFPVLNTSQNWYAEMLLKQLGRQFGDGGSWRGGLAVERRFLIDSMRVDSLQFALRDGSGLSSSNLMSPQAFATLLAWMRRHPHFETFAAGLPLSGQRGSLKTRFVGTPLEGKVRAKTGSISRVNTLSGYIELPGRTLTFSVEANNHTLGSRVMIAQIDSLVLQMGTK